MKTWKAEFYPTGAARCSKADALGHSLRKWRGLRLRARERHGLGASNGLLYEVGKSGDVFNVNSSTCALCKHHLDVVRDCPACPLALERGGLPCDRMTADHEESPYHSWIYRSDPEPMIRLLERASRRAARAARSK